MNFFKTGTGKAVLFVFTVFFTVMTIAGIGGVAICYEYGLYHNSTVSEHFTEVHDSSWMQERAEEVLDRVKAASFGQKHLVSDAYAFEVFYNGEAISYGIPEWYSDVSDYSLDFNAGIMNYLPYQLGFDTAQSFDYGEYTVTIWTTDNVQDAEMERTILTLAERFRDYWHFLAVGGAVMTLLCFIGLMSVAARRNKQTEPVAGLLNVIPFDLEILITVALVAIIFAGSVAIFENYSYFSSSVLYCTAIATGTLCISFFYGLCMELAARIKLKNVFSHTVIGWLFRIIGKGIGFVFRTIGKFFTNLPFIWAAVAITLFVSLAELIVILNIWDTGDFAVAWFFEKLILLPVLFYIFICMHKLNAGARALASGNISYKTDTSYMLLHFKEHGENLNHISEGLATAVNESIKSERMKTELITNVSHDIKTPLTSIINYSDLISKEKCDNEKIGEYAEVISRQSAKLKRLLEDLLELSKATTGNVSVNLEICDAGILLGQAVGEYEEKLQTSNITPVTTVSEENIYINADRRLLWRVFDNLLSNISKYALNGSRAFFTLSREGNKAVFRFKNTSRDMLNITPEELKARFVRGDVSRNTEGNGLGLSIAESLISAQGGKLDIYINADLFMATIIFDCTNGPSEQV